VIPTNKTTCITTDSTYRYAPPNDVSVKDGSHVRRGFHKIRLLQSALQPQLGSGLVNCRWAFSAGRFYRVPLPATRQTPNLEENQVFRAFQLSPQETPSVWSDVSEPSSGRWNYGRGMAKKFCLKWRLPRRFWVLLHAAKHDTGQTVLLPLRRKACWGFFHPKNPTASAGFEPANLGTKGQHATSRPPKSLTFFITSSSKLWQYVYELRKVASFLIQKISFPAF
jgi:hypothetical protein